MLMQNLPKLVDTYENVCGENNPFAASDVEDYGYTYAVMQAYMLTFYADLPVMDDYTKLHAQVVQTIFANAAKYAAMYAAQTAAAALDPTAEMHYTDTMARTGHDDLNKTGTETKTRTGDVENSGTDRTSNSGGVTDSVKTYDSGAYKDTEKSITNGTGSITHGKKTTYNRVADATSFDARKDETAYNSTFTRTVSGHKTNPAIIMQQYRDFCSNNNLFMEIIRDVVAAISCIVYIPVRPAPTAMA